MNSPPLYDQNTLILYSICVVTSALKSLNFSKHSLDFRVYTHTFLEKSSNEEYLALPIDLVLIGPHTSKFYNLERYSCSPHLHCWKTLPHVIYSQYMHHKSMKMWERNLPRFMPLTMFWMPSIYLIWTSISYIEVLPVEFVNDSKKSHSQMMPSYA